MNKAIHTTLCLCLAATALFAESCQSRKVYGLGEDHVTRRPIEAVLNDHTEELMSIPGVVGTAQGLCGGNPCIKVYVVRRTPELCAKIPGKLEGYPVEIEETGGIRALPGNGK